MKRNHLPVVALVLVAGLAQTKEANAAFATEGLSCTLTSAAEGTLATCDGSISDDGADITIALQGTAPNTVTRVALTRDSEDKPFQVLDMEAQPVIDPETVGILFIDLNFDGFRDLAVMEFLPSGPNVPYLYHLYDPGTRTYVRYRALDKITSPEVLKSQRRIRSNWRSSAAEAGEDLWSWQDGEPVLVEQVKKRWTSSGHCSAAYYRLKNGKLRQYRKSKCRN